MSATYSIWNGFAKPVSADISAEVSSSEVGAKAQRIANRTKRTVYVISPEGETRKVHPLDTNGVPLPERLHRMFLVTRSTMRCGEPWVECFFTKDKQQALTLASQWRREGHRVHFGPLGFSADDSRFRKPVYSASPKDGVVGHIYWFGYRPMRSGRCHAVGRRSSVGPMRATVARTEKDHFPFLALLGNQWVVLRLNKLDFAKSPACGRAAYETVKLV
jgi:hypothetical protein